MTRRRTELLKNDKCKGNIARFYKSITCLLLVGKLLTENIYEHLDNENLLPEEQGGCKKKARREAWPIISGSKSKKSRKKNLIIAWLDYKKAYDMIQHLWINECLRVFTIADNRRDFISYKHEEIEIDIYSVETTIENANIKRVIFQGDSLFLLILMSSS